MPGRQGEDGYYETLQPPRGGYARGRGAQGRDQVAQPLPRGQARGRTFRGTRGPSHQHQQRGDHQQRGGNQGRGAQHRGQHGGGHRGYPELPQRGGPNRGRAKGGDRDGDRGGTWRRPSRGSYDNRGYREDYHRSYSNADSGKIPFITICATVDDEGANHFDTSWDDWREDHGTYQQEHDHDWNTQDVPPQDFEVRVPYNREDDHVTAVSVKRRLN